MRSGLKTIIASLLGFSALFAEELLLENLDSTQRDNAFKIYKIAKPVGYEMTMIAIAWQESRLGKYPVNLQDPSCGAHHIHIYNFLKLKGIKDTSLNRNVYCSILINDIVLSTITALEMFLNFKKFHKDSYSKAIKSYNGGYQFANIAKKAKQTEAYYRQVYKNVKYLESKRNQFEQTLRMN